MIKGCKTPVRCGIVLAAGEGTRVQSFIKRIWGAQLPKQYVNFLGTQSLLAQTYQRLEKLISRDRLFTVVSQDHLQYPEAGRLLSERSKRTVALQPGNKDTWPGLLLPLMHLYKHYPEAVVVVMPSDHFIVEEDLFMGHVELAMRMVERKDSRMLLLGIDPHGPEPEYGYILSGKRTAGRGVPSVRRVLGFVEKPAVDLAKRLVQGRGLWNTGVMVSSAKTLIEVTKKVLPELWLDFERILAAIGTPQEMAVVQAVYEDLQPLNLSSRLLQVLPLHFPSCLDVLPVREVFWSDWGSEQRIVADLRKTGHLGPTESFSRETALGARLSPKMALAR